MLVVACERGVFRSGGAALEDNASGRKNSHVQDVNELYDAALWEEQYGVGRDPRCANCMMHCGFESATIFQAISTPLFLKYL